MLITPRPPEVHPTRDATWRLMRAVAAWAAFCPASSVAAMFSISEATVRRYEMDVLNADLPEPDLDNLEILLVDEKSVRKGHGYVTVVLNGLTGELLHMAEGKKKESLESFLSLLSERQRASIRAVCIDRNGAYRSVLAILKARFRAVDGVQKEVVSGLVNGEWVAESMRLMSPARVMYDGHVDEALLMILEQAGKGGLPMEFLPEVARIAGVEDVKAIESGVAGLLSELVGRGLLDPVA